MTGPERRRIRAKKVFKWVKTVDATMGQLGILVEDIKCQQAVAIINKGNLAMISYLLKHYSERELKDLIWHELQVLKRGGMVKQSKCQPDGNVPNKRSKTHKMGQKSLKKSGGKFL